MIGIRGKRRSLITSNQEDILHTPSQQIKAKVNAAIHNRFDIEVVDAKSGEVKQKAYAENVVCSQLWSKLLIASGAYFSYIHYGTGTGTPSSSDTSLFTFLGYGLISESTEVVTSDYANGVFSAKRQITLSETTAVGSTLTEVGIASGTTASTLCTHAMLKDMNGNQISITKTNTDIINIYATIYIHYSSNFLSMDGYINIRMGSTFLRYLAGMYIYGTSENNYAECPDYASLCRGKSFLSALYSSHLTPTYNVSSKTLTITMTRVPVGSGNGTGAEYLLLGINRGYSVYDPIISLKVGGTWYPGTNIVGEAIGTGDGSTVNFATDFDYPSNATVYADGVALTSEEVIVDNEPVYISDASKFFEPVAIENNIVYPDMLKTGFLNSGIAYNPNYSIGINTISLPMTLTGNYVYASDDCINWTGIYFNNSGTATVPEACRNCKYWKNVYSSAMSATFYGLTGNNIHFVTAPASGAVITADYHTPTIAKDVNHVFDFTCVIQLGEYSET